MKNVLIIYCITITLLSCKGEYYGTYNTNHLKDKSAFFQIKLNSDNSVEKTEVHTISDFAKGKFVKVNRQIICYLDSSQSKFPPDTLIFKLKGRKLFFVRKDMPGKTVYLAKE